MRVRSHLNYGDIINQIMQVWIKKLKTLNMLLLLFDRSGVIKVMAQSKISMVNQVFNIQNYKIGLGNNVSFK